MSPSELGDLLLSGRLQEVDPDPAGARTMVADAERHLASAAAILDTDPNGAYQLLYDGARKAIAARMLARSFRAANRPGAHAAVAAYAIAELGRGAVEQDARRFDRLRRNRNRSEYELAYFEEHQITADLAVARRLVVAVADELD